MAFHKTTCFQTRFGVDSIVCTVHFYLKQAEKIAVRCLSRGRNNVELTRAFHISISFPSLSLL